MNLIDGEPSLGFMETKILNPNTSYLSFGIGKPNENLNDHNMSDEDEPSFMEDDNSNKGRKGSSPWQRMKWSDTRVRLLIQVVACVGDDGTLDNMPVGSSRKSGCLQKKGKWKTVSKIMVSKGCQVSPQQCEDKFNDLNKRYKRLNDILGRGTSCKVVENPLLMESMPRLSAKAKEDVKKILNSKHLFYPEMCAYHNGQRIPNCTELDLMQVREIPVIGGQCSKENNRSSDEGGDNDQSDDNDDDDDDEHDRGNSGFREEMNEVFDDPNNTKLQKKEWVKKRMLHLQEQRVRIEAEAFEMEKRRFKWQRFCDRKDRELEISRLENERSMLENERMALQLKHREQVVESE